MSLSHGDFFYYLYNLWIINNFNAQLLSCVWVFATPWTVARQAPLSMGLSWQEYWSGLPFPPPGDLSDPGTESSSPTVPALTGVFSITKPPGKPISCCHYSLLYPSCVHFGQVSALVLLTCPYSSSIGMIRHFIYQMCRPRPIWTMFHIIRHLAYSWKALFEKANGCNF